jgi:hypothetical protein
MEMVIAMSMTMVVMMMFFKLHLSNARLLNGDVAVSSLCVDGVVVPPHINSNHAATL